VYLSILVQDDPTFKPKARLQELRNKSITIQRGTGLITLDPSSSTELWDGDAIHLVGGITVVFVTKGYRNAVTAEHVNIPLAGSLGIRFVAEAPHPLQWTRNHVGTSVSILSWLLARWFTVDQCPSRYSRGSLITP
jgi:hypothetical protein